MKADEEILILGAGHNGLVCACYLASQGLKVRILERRNIVGGAAVTEEFYPGFHNSTASFTVGLLDPQIIEDLKLRSHGLDIRPRPISNFYPLSDQESLTIYNNDEQTKKEFMRFDRQDAESLSDFRSEIRELSDMLAEFMQKPPSTIDSQRLWIDEMLATESGKQLSVSQRANLSELLASPVADLLKSRFRNPHIQAAFAFDSIVGHNASVFSPGTVYGLLHHAVGELEGQRGMWGYPIGGMGAITECMFKQAQALGVSVETEAEVAQVLVDSGRTTGAVLSDGTTRRAPIVVANLDPQQLYLELIDPSELNVEFREQLERVTAESAVLRINVALSELPRFTCKGGKSISKEHLQGGIVIGPTLDYMKQAYIDSRQGLWSKQPIVEMFISSMVDVDLAPPDKHVASLFCQYFPYDRDWDDLRDEAADTVFRAIDRFAPNFSGAVIGREVLTPLDLERRFRLPRGDIFHVAQISNQLGGNRPVSGCAHYHGPIGGLYHCGAGSHPGGGVTGLPGRNAAREILSDINLA